MTTPPQPPPSDPHYPGTWGTASHPGAYQQTGGTGATSYPVSPPPGYYPPPPPQRKRSFWGSPGGIILIVVGVFVLMCGGCGALATIGRISDNNAVKQLDVSVTSCSATSSVATMGYQVKNNGDQAKRVTLKVEYRDSSGARIDTDTAYVGSVPAGDTVRGEESTILNASPGGSITCKITDVS